MWLNGMAVTGFLLFSAEASHLALNPVFQLKAILVVAGLINVAIYEFWARCAVGRLAPGTATIAKIDHASVWRIKCDSVGTVRAKKTAASAKTFDFITGIPQTYCPIEQ